MYKNFSHISLVHISKSKRCFHMKSLTYYFHMKTNILADFQICISVPLSRGKWMHIPILTEVQIGSVRNAQKMLRFWLKIYFWSFFFKIRVTRMAVFCFIFSLYMLSFSVLKSRHTYAHSHPHRGSKWTDKQNAKITHILSIWFFQVASNCCCKNIA